MVIVDKNQISLGIDVGSVTTKIVLIDANTGLIYSHYKKHYAQPLASLIVALKDLQQESTDERVFYAAVTGSGRDLLSEALGIPSVNEIIAQTKAVAHFYLNAETIIEIGGQANFREYWQVALNQKPDHVFFVIDVTKQEDFKDFQEYLVKHKDFSQKTTLTVNKMDLIENVPDYITPIDSIINCSAKNGKGMLDILETVAYFRISEVSQISSQDTIGESGENDKEKAETILKKYQGKF